jgi:hypothetical protein
VLALATRKPASQALLPMSGDGGGLPSSLPGGLFVRKDKGDRQQQQAEQPQQPQRSMLGLDRLAAEKARERAALAAEEPMRPPAIPFKRPLPAPAHGDHERHYRRPREETPSHAGGVNEARSADIQQRVKERLKGKAQVFTSSSASGHGGGHDGGHGGGQGGGGAARVPASPAPSMSGSEWEAPSPRRQPLVPDRAQFGSEPRGFLDAGTPLGTPAPSSATTGIVHRPSHSLPTPQPSQGPHSVRGAGAAAAAAGGGGAASTPRHPGLGGDVSAASHAAGGVEISTAEIEDEWERASTVGGGGSTAAEDAQLERDWYDQDEGGGSTREAGAAPFVGDETLFAKREEQLRTRHRGPLSASECL